MPNVIEQFLNELLASSALEMFAVGLALAYLILAVRENIWCWAAAAASTVIYLYLFFDVALYAESALQVYYLAMAGYGYYQWRLRPMQAFKPIRKWSLKHHSAALLAILISTGLVGVLLTATDSQAPFLDAFTTCGSLIATYMVTQKILENWGYWFVVDSASIVLYLDRGLYFTALLFTVYLVIIIFGYLRWSRALAAQP
ncbi:MAG: nicotinamide riboside transporter PnuC [Pseudomonadales bacterium]|nr:nicotinamide riboside transporter PnuC [Pseudomonadales bacterium]